MARIAGYEIIDRVYAGPRSNVFRARRSAAEPTIILKTSATALPSPEQIARLEYEYAMLQAAAGEGVVRAVGLEAFGARVALVLEDHGGADLGARVCPGGLALAEFFELAIPLTDVLARLHAEGIVHHDIAPANVVVGGDGRVRLIDFGIASRVGDLSGERLNAPLLRGRLRYVSPEQTGRLDRDVDYRSDLYSLGATLYELLVGEPPFSSSDPLELIHCHIARTAPSPRERRSDLPDSLSRVIMRLLAKPAEERYRSAAGLREDLRACRRALSEGASDVFELGRWDPPSTFRLAERAYGREAEVAVLRGLLDEAASGGHCVAMVAGFSGVGKTTVTRELRRPVAEARGYFGASKLDVLRRDGARSPLVDALADVVAQALFEPETRLAALRRRLATLLGGGATVLLPLLPELEALLGGSVPANDATHDEDSTPAEQQVRLEEALRNLLAALAGPAHPVVLFVDDLQWADAATLQTFRAWARDERLTNLLLVGAYRDNEVDGGHPLRLAIEGVTGEGVALTELELAPLPEDAVSALLSDTLGLAPEAVRPLAHALEGKTGGNPFYLRVFLEELRAERRLTFSAEAGRWVWSLEGIAERDVTDNVATVLTARLERLPESTRALLVVAAALGGAFPVGTLSIAAGSSEVDVLRELGPAVEAGLVAAQRRRAFAVASESAADDPGGDAPEGGVERDESGLSLRFVHDRVQEGAYALCAEGDRAALHLRTARRLLAAGAPDAVAARVRLEVADQVVLGLSEVGGGAERVAFARILRDAGAHTLQATAFGRARRYLEAARSLTDAADWGASYDLVFGIHLDLTAALYQGSDHEVMEEVADIAVRHARNPEDAARVHILRVLALVAQHRYVDALTVAREALAALGVTLPREASTARVLRGLAATQWRLRGGPFARIAALPAMTEERELLALRLLSLATTPSYQAAPNLFPLLVFEMIAKTLRHGVGPDSPAAFAFYGVLLVAVLHDVEAASRWGELARELLARFPTGAKHAKVFMVDGVFLRIWVAHLDRGHDTLMEAYRVAIQSGDPETAAVSAMSYTFLLFFAGHPLPRVSAEANRFAAVLRRLGQTNHYKSLMEVAQLADNLRGGGHGDPLLLRGRYFDEAVELADPVFSQDQTFVTGLAYDRLCLCVCYDDMARAAENEAVVRANLEAYRGAPQLPGYYLWSGLVFARLLDTCPASERRQARRRLRQARAKLARYERTAPENAAHRRLLLDAELARHAGRLDEAVRLYEAAIAAARAVRHLGDEYLACRAAAQFWEPRSADVASSYWRSAYSAAERWGAEGVCAHLVERRGVTVHAAPALAASATLSGSTPAVDARTIDLEGLSRAARAISGEVQLDRLVGRVMAVASELGGATYGALLLDRGDGLRLEAEVRAGAVEVAGEGARAERSEGEGDAPTAAIPETLLSYVTRTKRSVVLDESNDAAGPLADAEDVRARGARSLLCAPLLHQGKLSGVLYLENDVTRGAFTPERVLVLETLSAQAAVSVENAALYQHLEEKIEVRTRELAATRREAQEARERAERLLRDILPGAVADELQRDGLARPVSYESTTVLFTDFMGFTRFAEDLAPDELLARLDRCFSAFDDIVERHGLEKLKTIGDGYLAVGGLPAANATHAVDAVLAGLEMVAFMERERQRLAAEGQTSWSLRVGIHTGPVIAGVVGRKRFSYDIWGDTVNTAARMESSGTPGRVNVSWTTHALVERWFECESRGRVAAKHKGEIEMFYVNGLRPAYRAAGDGMRGNETLTAELQALM